jgi:hypothetical protein
MSILPQAHDLCHTRWPNGSHLSGYIPYARGLWSGPNEQIIQLMSYTQGSEGHQLRPNLKTRLRTHPGSREPCPGTFGTGIAGTQKVNSPSNMYVQEASPPSIGATAYHNDKTPSGTTDSKSFSGQIKPVPHNTDSRNLLECCPP